MAFNSISDLWNKWNIRSLVILSLSLQVSLILSTHLRKKIASHHINYLLWLAYLMADSVVIYGVGVISHNQGNSCTCTTEVDGALQAFWASFLLLHLGGPDTITAFSLEDNLLWGRHLLSLTFQVNTAIYVFVQIFPNDKSLVIPTVLVFFAGVIKNLERTVALYRSSLPRLKKSMLSPDSPPDIHSLTIELSGIGHYDQEEAELPESTVVRHAYHFFQVFKVFIGDLMFGPHERHRSIEYFHRVSAMDALRVISVELHFMYEMLHTKALVIRSKWSYIFRFVAFTNLTLAIVVFSRLKKHQLPKLDVGITYSLLFGGMVVDVIAVFMLIFSDRTVAGYKTGSSWIGALLDMLICATDPLREPQYATYKAKPGADAMYSVLHTPFVFRRWSESISACNLLSEFLKQSPRKMYKHDRSWCIIAFSNTSSFPLRMAKKILSYFDQASEAITRLCGQEERLMIANTKYVSNNPFINELWIFIFKEIKRKSKNAETPPAVKETFEARGDLFLQSMLPGEHCTYLLPHVTETNYDGSIISWHLATEIWYNKEKPSRVNKERKFSKTLSDYMLYLFLNQHNVVSAVAGAAQMTSAAVLVNLSDHIGYVTKDMDDLCRRLYNLHFGGTSISAVSEGVILAQKMERLGDLKWEVMSGAWVEMLCYAAGHIRGEAHMQVLSKGGELLTFVWLLMAHFGCFYKPQWGTYYKPSFVRYKMPPAGFK